MSCASVDLSSSYAAAKAETLALNTHIVTLYLPNK